MGRKRKSAELLSIPIGDRLLLQTSLQHTTVSVVCVGYTAEVRVGFESLDFNLQSQEVVTLRSCHGLVTVRRRPSIELTS